MHSPAIQPQESWSSRRVASLAGASGLAAAERRSARLLAALCVLHPLILAGVIAADGVHSTASAGTLALALAVAPAAVFAVTRSLRAAASQARATHETAEAEMVETQRAVSAREAELTAAADRAARAHSLLEGFGTEELHEGAAVMLGNADQLGATAAKASAQVITVSIAAEDTARKAELAAQAVEELACTIGEVGNNASQSSGLATAAVAEAERTSATLDEMATVAEKISKVTGLIAGIAAQTNLLALTPPSRRHAPVNRAADSASSRRK